MRIVCFTGERRTAAHRFLPFLIVALTAVESNAEVLGGLAGEAGSWVQVETNGATIYNATGLPLGTIRWTTPPLSRDYDHVFVTSDRQRVSLYRSDGGEIIELEVDGANVSTVGGNVYLSRPRAGEVLICDTLGNITRRIEQVHAIADAYGDLFATSEGLTVTVFSGGRRVARFPGANEQFALGDTFVALLHNNVVTVKGLLGETFGTINEPVVSVSAADRAVVCIGDGGLGVFDLFGTELYRDSSVKVGQETRLSSRGLQVIVGAVGEGRILRLTSDIPWERRVSSRLFTSLKAQADEAYVSKNYEMAEYLFSAAIRSANTVESDKLADAWCWVGDCRRRLGRHEEALEAYATSLSINPSDANAHNGSGASYARLGRRDETFRAFCRAAELGGLLARKNLRNWESICSAFDWNAPTDEEKRKIQRWLSEE